MATSTTSMLQNDIDDLHRSSTDVLLSSFTTTTTSLPTNDAAAAAAVSMRKGGGGGDVEMSRIMNHNNNHNDIPSQQQPSHHLQPEQNIEEANSEWVNHNSFHNNKQSESKENLLYAKYNIITRKEIIICILAVITMITITIVAVTIAVQNHNEQQRENAAIPIELMNRIIYDKVQQRWVSTYTLPTRSSPTIIISPTTDPITDEDELLFIRETFINHPILSNHAIKLPITITELNAITFTTDPYVLGAQWITTMDTYNDKEHTINRYVLAVLYYSLSGNTWYNNTNWLSSTEYYCNWYGIVCCNDDTNVSVLCNNNASSGFGNIIEIDLYRNNLTGTIPDVISLLNPYLFSIYMSQNRITGTLPGDAIATLSQLGRINLAYNFLTGTVPVSLQANGVLDTLYIHGNNFNGTFPMEFNPPLSDDNLINFGVDCEDICPDMENLCKYNQHCFHPNNTITTK